MLLYFINKRRKYLQQSLDKTIDRSFVNLKVIVLIA